MNTAQLLLSGLALLLSLSFSGVVIMRWNINSAAFLKVVLRLVGDDDLARVERLCQAVPAALLPAAIEPVVACARTLPADPLATLAGVAHDSLQQAELRIARHARLGVVAGLALVASLLFGALSWDPQQPVGWIVGGLALAILAAGGQRLVKLRADLQSMPVPLLQALVEARGEPVPLPDLVVQQILAAGEASPD